MDPKITRHANASKVEKKKKKEKETAEHAVERGEWEEITRRGWQGRAKDIGRAWN